MWGKGGGQVGEGRIVEGEAGWKRLDNGGRAGGGPRWRRWDCTRGGGRSVEQVRVID